MGPIKLDNAQWATIIIALIGIVSPLLTLAISIFEKYLSARQKAKEYNYEQYHKLILEISSNIKVFAGCQIAEIFELRRFRKNRLASINVLKSFYNFNKAELDKKDNYVGRTIDSTINSLSCPIPIVWRFKK